MALFIPNVIFVFLKHIRLISLQECVSSGGENLFVPCYDLYILQIVMSTVDLNSTTSVLFTVCAGSLQLAGTTDSASTKIN